MSITSSNRSRPSASAAFFATSLRRAVPLIGTKQKDFCRWNRLAFFVDDAAGDCVGLLPCLGTLFRARLRNWGLDFSGLVGGFPPGCEEPGFLQSFLVDNRVVEVGRIVIEHVPHAGVAEDQVAVLFRFFIEFSTASNASGPNCWKMTRPPYLRCNSCSVFHARTKWVASSSGMERHPQPPDDR